MENIKRTFIVEMDLAGEDPGRWRINVKELKE